MMRNADKVAAEAMASSIAEDAGYVHGASADMRGIGAGAAASVDGSFGGGASAAVAGARVTRSGKIKTHVASASNKALYTVLGVLAVVTV